MAIALYPGSFKPPHKGHFNVAKQLATGNATGKEYNLDNYQVVGSEVLSGDYRTLSEVDKVVVFIGGGVRDNVDQALSKEIWDTYYSNHLPSNVEIIAGDDNPMKEAKDYAKKYPEEKFYAITGIRGEEDYTDLKRLSTFKNLDNVTGVALTSPQDKKISATSLRKAALDGNIDSVRDFFPKELTGDEILKILDKLKQVIIAEMKAKQLESPLSKKIATQVEGVFNAWFDKEEPVKTPLKEGSGGTPIAPMSAIKSSDRHKLVTLHSRLRNMLGDDFYKIIFNQDHIRIQLKGGGLNETLESESFDFTPHIASILEYMIDEGMNILPIPEVKLVRDEHNAKELFGRTAHYNPVEKEIVLYIEGRHPKDVLRSFAHEMIHHKQNLEQRLHNISTTNTNEDDNLLELEKEAYLEGNITFRNWEDGIKNKKSDEVLTEGRYDKISNKISSDLFNAFKNGEKDFYNNYYNDDLDFDVFGTFIANEEEKYFSVDGDADYDETGEGNDSIQVIISYNPEVLPRAYKDISFTLKDLVRHEIEHLTHGESDNLKKGKYIEDDSLIRALIKTGVLPKGDYFKLAKEIDANIQGMYFRAKKEKRPFAEVVREYLDDQNIPKEDYDEIIELMRKRLPALGINQPLEEAQQEPKFTVYCDMDGVLCNFEKQFQSLDDSKGMTPKQFEKQGGNIYPIIEKEGKEFWSKMEWMPNGRKLWDNIKQYNPTILTSPFYSDDPKNDLCRKGKIDWCEKNLGIPEDRVIFAGKNEERTDVDHAKFYYAANNTILIDDMNYNINPFNAKGGIGLLYLDSNVDEVLQKITKLQTSK